MLGPITRAVEKRGSSTVNVSGSRIAVSTRSWRVTSQPSRLGSHDTGSCPRRRGECGMRVAFELLECDRRAEREECHPLILTGTGHPPR